MDDGRTPLRREIGVSRRGLLRGSGLVGAGALVATAGHAAATAGSGLPTGPQAAGAPRAGGHPRWQVDVDAPRFTVAVMPDTQYLFDGDALNPEPIAASLDYVLRRQRELNIAFFAHLGDVVQNARASEIAAASPVFDVLDEAGAAWSVLAGNHDIDESTNDQRGRTAYLDAFGPQRFARSPSFRGSSPGGYNTFHTFRAAGREWLVLSLDWRLSPIGVAWARSVLARHRTLPTIVISHELVTSVPGTTRGELSPYGVSVWDEVVRGFDQVFLTLNGHDWPATRVVRRNDAGHDVEMHLTNYQQRYFGGAAMLRLYHFDLERGVVDVETVNPFFEAMAPEQRNTLAAQEVELSGETDRFTMPLDPAARFAGFAPVAARPRRAAEAVLVPGTVAYWRFEGATAGAAGRALSSSTRVRDHSGQGNDLVVATSAGSGAGDLRWSPSHHPDQPSGGSLLLSGRARTGTCLRTVDGAPLDTATFERGYTVEAFVQIPDDFDPATEAFAAVLSRRGSAGEAGLAGTGATGDRDEPLATLSLSNLREPQWCAYPTSTVRRGSSITCWGHQLPLGTWWHLAVVNDTRRTTLYVDGCAVARNPATPNRGLTTLDRSWLLGGYDYAGRLEKTFRGWIGDVRLVARPLDPRDFLIA